MSLFWDPITEPYDKLYIGGVLSPGICEISGADSPRNWEERRGPGLSGAIVVFRGVMLSHFAINFRLSSVRDWQDWQDFAEMVKKPPIGKRPRALEVAHPLLEGLGIRAVVIENVIAPEQTADGEWTATLKVIEYRNPKPAQAKPEGATDKPIDPVEAEIKRRREANQAKRDYLATLP